jgi:SAM-dependent methyltransferase
MFLGIFIGIVPIYGFQTLAAVGVALFFKLNKPLTVAGTFINNPLLQPVIVVSSVELGYFLRGGSFRPFHLSALTGAHMKEELLAWAMGSVVLGVLVGGVGAALTAVVVRLKAPANAELRDRIRFVNRMFAQCDRADRGFVRWKLRLDRIFELLAGLLAAEDLASGTVVDLGCGYGMVLSFAAFGDSSRRLVGCDLDAHRIAVARQALSALNADLSVADVRSFDLPPAGLILILDVLQYLPADEQLGLLKRCCAALVPEGRLIIRVHDRERGLWSAITMAFDRLIFAWGRADTRPLMLAAADYHGVLEAAGMQVEERRFRNRLPLAHILFIAKKTFTEAATEGVTAGTVEGGTRAAI